MADYTQGWNDACETIRDTLMDLASDAELDGHWPRAGALQQAADLADDLTKEAN